MSGIVGSNLGRGSGLVKSGGVGADAVGGANIADDAVDSEHIADNAVGLAALASGTDGQIITYDASGNPTAVGPGTDGQVLTSTGAGSPPAFEAAAGGMSVSDITGATAIGITPGNTDEFILNDSGTLKRMDAIFMKNTPYFNVQMANDTTQTNGVETKILFDSENADTGSAYNTTTARFTVPAYQGGDYFFKLIVKINNMSDGDNVQTYFQKNSAWMDGQQSRDSEFTTASGEMVLQTSYTDRLVAGDYVEAYIIQWSGDNSTIMKENSSMHGFKLITDTYAP